MVEDDIYGQHHAPRLYGFQSFISMPIILPRGRFFGTLVAIDQKPHLVNTPQIIGMFKVFAELIAVHLEANLRAASCEATMAADRKTAELREQFIAVLGHDLRNPLAAIESGINLLLRRPEQTATLIDYMRKSIARMTELIDNVLDFARGRLGDGMMLMTIRLVPLQSTIEQVVAELRNSRGDHVLDVQLDLREPVNCDRDRIAQLVSNLLGNAMTHGTPEMPIRLRAATRDGHFTLSVTNGGEPISPEARAKLFQPFFRGAVRPDHEGLGLGLYIAFEIARAHGGTLEVSSTPRETCFTFRMPL